MRRYLSTLHRQPEEHKKRFAFLASATITLFIFSIWSLANFGVKDAPVMAEQDKDNSVSPFQSFGHSLAGTISGFQDALGAIKDNFGPVNFEAEYQQLRDSSLETYGR